jgi:hypothetical protein
LLITIGMLISRCAWHPRNYGHAKLMGVASWRGLRIGFTDGICRKCAARVRAPGRRVDTGRDSVRRGGGRASAAGVAALAVLTGLVLAAQPANEGAGRVADTADLLPRAAARAGHDTTGAGPPRPARARAPRPEPPAAAVDLRTRGLRERLVREALFQGP